MMDKFFFFLSFFPFFLFALLFSGIYFSAKLSRSDQSDALLSFVFTDHLFIPF